MLEKPQARRAWTRNKNREGVPIINNTCGVPFSPRIADARHSHPAGSVAEIWRTSSAETRQQPAHLAENPQKLLGIGLLPYHARVPPHLRVQKRGHARVGGEKLASNEAAWVFVGSHESRWPETRILLLSP